MLFLYLLMAINLILLKNCVVMRTLKIHFCIQFTSILFGVYYLCLQVVLVCGFLVLPLLDYVNSTK